MGFDPKTQVRVGQWWKYKAIALEGMITGRAMRDGGWDIDVPGRWFPDELWEEGSMTLIRDVEPPKTESLVGSRWKRKSDGVVRVVRKVDDHPQWPIEMAEEGEPRWSVGAWSIDQLQCDYVRIPSPSESVGATAQEKCGKDIGGMSAGVRCNRDRGHAAMTGSSCNWHRDRGPMEFIEAPPTKALPAKDPAIAFLERAVERHLVEAPRCTRCSKAPDERGLSYNERCWPCEADVEKGTAMAMFHRDQAKAYAPTEAPTPPARDPWREMDSRVGRYRAEVAYRANRRGV